MRPDLEGSGSVGASISGEPALVKQNTDNFQEVPPSHFKTVWLTAGLENLPKPLQQNQILVASGKLDTTSCENKS